MIVGLSVNDVDILVDVIHYVEVPPYYGSVWNCESSDDWWGYTELEYDVMIEGYSHKEESEFQNKHREEIDSKLLKVLTNIIDKEI